MSDKVLLKELDNPHLPMIRGYNGDYVDEEAVKDTYKKAAARIRELEALLSRVAIELQDEAAHRQATEGRVRNGLAYVIEDVSKHRRKQMGDDKLLLQQLEYGPHHAELSAKALARIRELEAELDAAIIPLPIETAPARPVEFLASNRNGDWLKVTRHDMPEDFTGPSAVIHYASGRWWIAKYWMPLPEPPKQEKTDD